MKIKTIERSGLKISFVNEEEFERIYEDIFEKNEYPFKTNNSTPIILDCGAHIGLSVLCFKNLYPKSIITAFEPNPLTFKLLKQNIDQNNIKNVKLINAAVYDSGGEIDFYVEKDLEHPWSWGDSAVVNKWYSENKNKTIKVKAIQLSSFLNKPIDLLKLDVEGLEERILLSIEDKFNNVGEIMLEYHGSSTNPNNDISNVLTVLRKNGFRCRIKQGRQFIKEGQIKKDDPFWLSIYARNLSIVTN